MKSLLPASSFPEIEPQGPSSAAFVTSVENSVVTKNERLTQLFIASAHKPPDAPPHTARTAPPRRSRW